MRNYSLVEIMLAGKLRPCLLCYPESAMCEEIRATHLSGKDQRPPSHVSNHVLEPVSA